METNLPPSVKATLWSYDTAKLDLKKDSNLIINNVLINGGLEAVKWLFNTYKLVEIEAVVSNPPPGEWDQKSLNYWAIIFNINRRNPIKKIPDYVLDNLG